jgi:hypothetical protein
LSDTDTAIKQAELILKLYELRREPVMRIARSYIGGEFLPRSLEDFLAIMSAGDQHTAYVLQVYGYWDMVAALVFHGVLDESLVYGACPEMYFQFAKIRPYIEEFRNKSSLPERSVVEGPAVSPPAHANFNSLWIRFTAVSTNPHWQESCAPF